MNDCSQDLYAKHLQDADHGYPLRMPEPMSTLPEKYQKSGLQIGDVGIVNSKGQFDVLFNVGKSSDNTLHLPHGVPEHFQPIPFDVVNDTVVNVNAIPRRPIISQGIEEVPREPNKPRLADYEFRSHTRTGALLLLPHGATSVEHSSPEHFREMATNCALDWHEFARKRHRHLDRSLYLITGFHKARSWALGSFNHPEGAKITIQGKRNEENPDTYRLDFSLRADHRHGCSDNSSSNNQTVFITGFTITISNWLPDPLVQKVAEPMTIMSILTHLFSYCRKRLRGFSGGHKQHGTIHVEHSPPLSQPFHPSDIINRFLLSKERNARIAVTHDNQWMVMMKEGLTHAELIQEDRLESFLTRERYSISVSTEHKNTHVFLRSKASTMDSGSTIINMHDPQPKPEILDPSESASELEVLSTPTDITSPSTPEPNAPSSSTSEPESHFTRSADNPRIFITYIRAQNVSISERRIPVGLYVLVKFEGSQRRTQNKPIRLNDDSIEWEERILLPSKALDKVHFTVYASFELGPMLGNGEALYTTEICVEELIGGTCLIRLSSGPAEPGTANPGPSLLITTGQWYSNRLVLAQDRDDSNLDAEEFSSLAHETDLGHEALLRYHDEYRREHLENAIQHFDRAWRNRPSRLTPQHLAVVLVNLGRAKFMSYRMDPASTNLDESILLYQEALTLRRPGHPDRPAVLLQLAQALLLRYEKEECNESIAKEIKELVTEPKAFAEDSHERLAADLVLETLQRCRVVNSGNLAELDDLVTKLKHSVTVPPGDYFDRPQRLINLSTTLWKRFEKYGELDDLDESVEVNTQAVQLLSGNHPDRYRGLRTLGAMLWRVFAIHRDLKCLRKLITLSEEALQLMPAGHPEHPYWVTKFTIYCSEMSECLGDTAFEDERYDEAIAKYSQAIATLQSTYASGSSMKA